MIMKKYLVLLCCIYFTATSQGQQQFLAKGKIEYERRINVHRQFDWVTEEDGAFFKEYISKLPKVNITYFELSFSGSKTIYKPGKREAEGTAPNMWGIGPAKENLVLTDLQTQQITGLKKIFEETFLVQDSVRKPEWKISDESRTIAGFECRKAVAKLFDSVYIVAFYTDEISTSGGPESFNGLPGMILEIAIPRLYTTWIATKVELSEPPETEFVIKGRGKKVNEKGLFTTLQSSMKDWGKQGNRYLWWAFL
jgi:GLPGLI family protein